MKNENDLNLFTSFKIGNVTVKNRLAVAPMTRISATFEGVPDEKMNKYYESFAAGDFGLIITEGTYIDDKYSQTYKFQPGIVFGDQIFGWKKIVDSIHKNGAKVFMQIQHSGSLSQGNRFKDETLAPSAVQPKGNQLDFYYGGGPFALPKEANKAEIGEVINAFSSAAINAKEAGFDGVEIHGANGYLLDQFLTDYTNMRKDEYGGNLENRLRVFGDVIKSIREKVGNDFVVGIRISQGKVNDHFHKWQDEDEAEQIFSYLKKAGIDYIHVTEFLATAPAFDEIKYRDKSNISSLAAIAKRVTDLPILVNGQINSASVAMEVLNSKAADILTIGKAALANHNFPKRLQLNLELNTFDAEKTLRPTAEIKDFELI